MKVITTKMGYARRNRPGNLDWAQMAKVFPDHKEQIKRIRRNVDKLFILGQRLVKKYGLPR